VEAPTIRKAAHSITLFILLFFLALLGRLSYASNNNQTEPIYIRADGSIKPENAPIKRYDNFYTLTRDINCSLVIERDNIVFDGQNHTIYGNIEFESKGVILQERRNVTIKNLKITAFYYGIWLSCSQNNKLITNLFTNCTGRSILLSNSNCNIIHKNFMWENKGRGIMLVNSHNNTLTQNKIVSGGCDAIIIHHSNYNFVAQNEITENNGRGIWLGYSNNTVVIGNKIFSNNYDGIKIYYSCNNIIFGNTVSNNNCNGISLEVSNNNTIVNNNFVNNFKNVLLISSLENTWNYQYPLGGNYWSDIELEDNFRGPYQNFSGSDGIVDKAFYIDENNVDAYPLIGLLSEFNICNNLTLRIVSNWNVDDINYIPSNGALKLSLSRPVENATFGFCQLRVTHVFISPPYIIMVDGSPQAYVKLFENETLSIIYFNFNGSTVEISIIPEFHPTPLSMLIMILLPSSTVIFKRLLRKMNIFH